MECKCCNKEVKAKACSDKKDGVFYFICDNCGVLHKAWVDKESLELNIVIAPDEDIYIADELLNESLSKLGLELILIPSR